MAKRVNPATAITVLIGVVVVLLGVSFLHSREESNPTVTFSSIEYVDPSRPIDNPPPSRQEPERITPETEFET